MDYKNVYQEWLENPYFDEAFRNELAGLAGNETEIEDRFYRDLEFGTAGMRGIIGAGRNRINRYIVQKATQGFANYLLKYEKRPEMSAVIAYDNRKFSDVFAMEAAQVLAANGIKAYLFESLRTTPELSFTVRQLKAAGGIVITASHNPPAYNGYKVYGPDGAQLMPTKADQVVEEVSAVDNFDKIKSITSEEALGNGSIQWIGKEIDELYFKRVSQLAIRPEVYSVPMKIVYTPLHGTGGYPILEVMKGLGVTDLVTVDEQMIPDCDFTTAPKPNPEESQAFELALKYGVKNDAELLIATDPDSDRMGIMAKNRVGQFVLINGNQIGALLLEYILSSKNPLPENGAIIKTVVTSDLGRSVAEHYGVTVLETLTGFKFIGDRIRHFEETGEHTFLMGYEESYGYLVEDFVRDKDAVSAVMLFVEMAKYYKQKGQSLLDVLEMLFQRHGYYIDGQDNIVLEGKEGLDRMKRLMGDLRETPLKMVGGTPIETIIDIKTGTKYTVSDGTTELIDLPPSDVLKYYLKGGSWFAVRPSGTEPKIKIYYSVCASDRVSGQTQLEHLTQAVREVLKP